MKIIISPAKIMKEELDIITPSIPYFLEDAKGIRQYLMSLNKEELKKIWKANDKIIDENIQRFKDYNFSSPLTPSLLAYDGLQFKNIAASVLSNDEWDYLNNHLFILSAMYGVLLPTDGIIPYRLEMQAKVNYKGYNSLYDYWHDKIIDFIYKNDNVIINLASKEYSDVIAPFLNDDKKMINIIFAEVKEGKLITRSTAAKTARGTMIRWLAENKIENYEEIKKFNLLNYEFSKRDSDNLNYIFIKR